MCTRLLIRIALALMNAHLIAAAEYSQVHASSSESTPNIVVPDNCGSGRARRFTLMDPAYHRTPSVAIKGSVIRRGKSASPPRGGFHASKGTLRTSSTAWQHRMPLKTNVDEREALRSMSSRGNAANAYNLLTFVHSTHVIDQPVTGQSQYPETIYLTAIDPISGLTLQEYLKERHAHEMPGIIARCQYIKDFYYYSYAPARRVQIHVEQALVEGITPYHPGDKEKLFFAAEYYLVGEDMEPKFLGIVAAPHVKLDPNLKKILNFELPTSKSYEAHADAREVLANQWFTIGSYLNAHKNNVDALVWLTKASAELQTIARKHGHVLYAIADSYWQQFLHNDWQSRDHEFEYLIPLGWLLKARYELKKEVGSPEAVQTLDMARNLFGRVYEKIGEVANKREPTKPDKVIIPMNDNAMESASSLIGKAFGKYNKVLKPLDMHVHDEANEPSSSTETPYQSHNTRLLLYALVNILCLFERQKSLCPATIATNMAAYAHHLLGWKNKDDIGAYKREEQLRYMGAHRAARAFLLRQHREMKVKKMPVASPRLSSSGN